MVEIGASDGAENCTAELVAQGWSGIWIEGDPDKASDARARAAGYPVSVVESYVDRESIVPVLEGEAMPTEPDLLVIDVDGNDYWIWKAVADHYRPRVVVIEYNAVVGPYLRWIMPYAPDHRWSETAWHGASLAALARLGQRLDYVLVGCDSQGVNAFFVRSKYASSFNIAPVRDQWVPPLYMLPYGHPIRPFDEFDLRPLSSGSDAKITVEFKAPKRTALCPDQTLYLDVKLRNQLSVPIGCSGDNPLQLAYWWLDHEGDRVAEDAERCYQPWRCDPHRTCRLVGRVRAPGTAGVYSLVLGLVQENVRWLDGAKVGLGSWTVRRP
jgi:hypothetical protein